MQEYLAKRLYARDMSIVVELPLLRSTSLKVLPVSSNSVATHERKVLGMTLRDLRS
jgi:hypothetical protein